MTTNQWTPPPPVIFKYDEKNKPDQYAAYTVQQLHEAHEAGRAEMAAENVALRQILVDAVAALGSGAGASQSSSLQFLADVPKEVRATVEALRDAAAESRHDQLNDGAAAALQKFVEPTPAEELAESDALREKLGRLLSATAIALKGPEPPLTRWSWHDLPEIAAKMRADLADMEARKDAAYLERNQVVAALAKCFPSGTARTAIEGWSEDWHGAVYIDLPTGQASWHHHDSHAHLFEGLGAYTKPWDGHTTPEKYERLAALASARTQAHELALKWPHIGADEFGCATLEWWNGERKITLYTVGNPHEILLKSWGPKIHDDMAYVSVLDAHAVRQAFDWLGAAPQLAEPIDDDFRIPITLPDGRIAKMRKCDLWPDDLVTFIDSANLPPAGPPPESSGAAQS